MTEALHNNVIYTNQAIFQKHLYMAMELSDKTWKLGFSDGSRNRQRNVPAGDLAATLWEIEQAKIKFKLASDTKVLCCYEAGRDGFWIHNWLLSKGVHNFVIDSASIEQSRKKRKVKTDKIDVRKMVGQLMRFIHGEAKALSVVQAPNERDEDARRLHRERKRLVKERGAHSVRIGSLLIAQGVRGIEVNKHFLENLDKAKRWNGEPIGQQLKAELQREYERFQLANTQIAQLEKEQQARVKQAVAIANEQGTSDDPLLKVDYLMALKGIGWQSSWVLVHELFGWRHFANRKKLGGFVGLTGTPYDSGDSNKEQGISKAGNAQLRSLLIELAWMWVRYQPNSALTKWFERRYAHNGKRMRRVGIVAVARRLLIELWKYLRTGEVPNGAIVKA